VEAPSPCPTCRGTGEVLAFWASAQPEKRHLVLQGSPPATFLCGRTVPVKKLGEPCGQLCWGCIKRLDNLSFVAQWHRELADEFERDDLWESNRMTTARDIDPDADELREAMVAEVRALGAIQTDRVAAAFCTVPRHLFVPAEPLETAYAPTRAIVTKRNEHGAATSSLSEAHIQAVMLEQAQLEPGMTVLEIGTGGYNAALIAELVGDSGKVISVDIDPDIVDRARNCLTAAGYDQVTVVLADAENGVPDHAPYDRVIVTAGAWDIPPTWSHQLADGGRIAVPLRMRGLTRSVTFEQDGSHLVSRDYRLCGFVPMQGNGAHSERLIPIDGDRVVLRVDGEQPVDGDGLRDALASPRVERWSGVEVGGTEPFDDLDLWLATAADGFSLLTATKEAIDSGLVTASARAGAKTIVVGTTFAYRPSARPVDEDRTRFEFGAYAHGPDAAQVADELVELIRMWDREHRAGPDPRIEVHPAETPDEDLPAGRVIDKKHTRVVISWP
jgi:protein-L-isoaspartate(D-aspartate) O-methyltransferase